VYLGYLARKKSTRINRYLRIYSNANTAIWH